MVIRICIILIMMVLMNHQSLSQEKIPLEILKDMEVAKGTMLEQYLTKLESISESTDINEVRGLSDQILDFWETPENNVRNHLRSNQEKIRDYLLFLSKSEIEFSFEKKRFVKNQFYAEWQEGQINDDVVPRYGYLFEVEYSQSNKIRTEYILVSSGDKKEVVESYENLREVRNKLKLTKDENYERLKPEALKPTEERPNPTPTYTTPDFQNILSAKYKKGDKINLRWTGNPQDRYVLELWKEGKPFKTIASNIQTESYPVTLYKSYGKGKDYRFRLTSMLSELSARSDNFQIRRGNTLLMVPVGIVGAAAVLYYFLSGGGEASAEQVNFNDTLPDPPCPSGNGC